MFLFLSVDEMDQDDDDVSMRVGRTVAMAYARANDPEVEDGGVLALTRTGVILPNGFTPMPPLVLDLGEKMCEEFL